MISTVFFLIFGPILALVGIILALVLIKELIQATVWKIFRFFFGKA